MNTIESGWDDFKENLINENMPDYFKKFLKLAFYSGASAVLRVDYEVSAMGLSTENAALMMDTLHDERLMFFKEMKPDCTIHDIRI